MHPGDLIGLSSRITGIRQLVLDMREAKEGSEESEEGYQRAVRDLWVCVREWAVAQMNIHGDPVDPEDIAKRIEELDPPPKCSERDYECFEEFHLSAEVLDLKAKGPPSYVISVNYPRMGTFFIVAKDGTGRYSDAWNIYDLALKHYQSKDEIGYWAFLYSMPYSDAPLVGSIHPLPPSANGTSRFYVDAFAALEAGGTFPKQIGVWEWNGVNAVPLLIRTYSSSFESGEVTFKGGELRIPMKGQYKRFFSCGQCTEPLVIWTVKINPDAVTDLGRRDAIPELRLVDEIWDRVFNNSDLSGLAAPAVAKRLRDLYESLKVENEEYGKFDSLSMLGTFRVFADAAGRHLYFNADNLNCNELRFLVEERNGHIFFSELQVQDICKHANQKCSDDK